MATFDQVEFEDILKELDEDHQRVDRAPAKSQLLGPFTIMCLFLNRTIGSGIFVAPAKVLLGTGSVGASLLLWTFGGLIHLCGLLIWLELGLSVPFRTVPGSNERTSVPRSGGEKNFLEFIFHKPRFLTTCMYGIPYIILGNLAGNSIAIGSFIMDAAHRPRSRGPVIGIALTVLTAAVLLHVCSRRGGILVNNGFAVVKVLILVSIIILGFIKAGGNRLGGAPPTPENFNPDISFSGEQRGVTDYARAFIGVRKPRQNFPQYTLIALFTGFTLYMLVNVAYFLVVPKQMQLDNPDVPMAALFFGQMFGNEIAKQALSVLVALSIFGNIVVMTFTASRVKQEIAKEGILPFSLFFASSRTTPYAWLKARWKSRPAPETVDVPLEQTPMAALGLHWGMSVILVGVTAMLPPSTSYSVLVELYSYALRILVPLVVSGGLLYLKFNRNENWSSKANYKTWISPFHVILYFGTLAFLAIALFVKPPAGSPFTFDAGHVKWFIVPSVGISAFAWGSIWFLGLRSVMWSKGRVLTVTRTPFIVPDGGSQWVQKAELVEHEWHVA